jgi:FkbM family methyltransferase
VFSWLERHAVRRYDAVIDIGANVGLYSLFFDALIQRAPAGRLRCVYAFEPSRIAYCRLVANLEVNDAHTVEAFPVAIGDTTGFAHFYQPVGRLVNGSLSRDFAELFSQSIIENQVVTLVSSQLSELFARHRRVLMKIDAEGLEPRILAAMAPVLQKHRPDMLLEVLEHTDTELNKLVCLKGYVLYLVGRNGPSRRVSFAADRVARDWLVTASPLEDGEMKI